MNIWFWLFIVLVADLLLDSIIIAVLARKHRQIVAGAKADGYEQGRRDAFLEIVSSVFLGPSIKMVRERPRKKKLNS